MHWLISFYDEKEKKKNRNEVSLWKPPKMTQELLKQASQKLANDSIMIIINYIHYWKYWKRERKSARRKMSKSSWRNRFDRSFLAILRPYRSQIFLLSSTNSKNILLSTILLQIRLAF